MSPHFPDYKYRDIVKILKNLRFVLLRTTKSSHEIWYRKLDNKYTTVPNHGSKSLKRKTIKSIIEDTGLKVEDFVKQK